MRKYSYENMQADNNTFNRYGSRYSGREQYRCC